MTPTASRNSTQPAVTLLREHVRTVDDERGFALVFAICMLTVCVLIGIAAMNTSVDEMDITRNEVMVRRTLTYAMSGVPLAALPIESKKGEGSFPTNNYVLEDSNNYITILHAGFLDELADRDLKTYTGWNNATKWGYATSTAQKTNFKPIDDVNCLGDPTEVAECADIRIEKMKNDGTPDPGSLFTILVDVDRLDPKPDKGGNTGFGEDPDVLMTYVMDCKATLPGKDIDNTATPPPVNEVVIGYYFRPGAAF